MLHYTEIITVLLICYFSCWTSAQSPCATPEGFQGTCINLRQCEVLFNLLRKNNLSKEEVDYLRNAQCGYQGRYPWVCCAINTSPPQPTSQPAVELPRPGVCGSQLEDRIVGGEETRITEFPWMALIEYKKPAGGKGFHCGGVLITDQYVLTASHCVNGKDLQALRWTISVVRLGEWNQQSPIDCDDGNCSDPVQDIPVVDQIPHRYYNPQSKSQENDIALLRLERAVRFTDWVKPICLPVNDIVNRNFDGLPLIVSGWGKTETNSNSEVKLKVEVDGVSIDACNQVYRAQNVILTNKQLCAGGQPGRDSCRGDSGGPLMARQKHNMTHVYYYLAGVVSFGPTPCGLPNWPGVYTRVDQYVDWILENMKNRNVA